MPRINMLQCTQKVLHPNAPSVNKLLLYPICLSSLRVSKWSQSAKHPCTNTVPSRLTSSKLCPCHPVNICFDSKSHFRDWTKTQEDKLHLPLCCCLKTPPPWPESARFYYHCCCCPVAVFACAARTFLWLQLNLLLCPVTTKQWGSCLAWLWLTSTKIALMGTSLPSTVLQTCTSTLRSVLQHRRRQRRRPPAAGILHLGRFAHF